MRILILLPGLVFFLLSGCGLDFNNRKEDYIIEKEKFVKVLAEIHIMDAVTNGPNYFRKYEPTDSVDLYSFIFSKYDVSRENFDSTVAYYSRQPEVYMNIYDEVLLELNLRRDSIQPEQKIKERRDIKNQLTPQ